MARQRGGVLSTSQHALVVSINLFTALLCACIVLGHLLEENWLLNIGLCIDVVILLTTKGRARTCLSSARNSSSYTSCPPSSCTCFQVKKKQFFRYFMTIILFGAVGTMISFFTISLDMVVLDGQTWWSVSEKQRLRKKRLSSMWLIRAEQYGMVDQNSFLTS